MSLQRCWTAHRMASGRSWMTVPRSLCIKGQRLWIRKVPSLDGSGGLLRMIGEGGSEWSVVELYSDYAANRSHNVQIPECYGVTKRICTILHATCGNFFTFCTEFKMNLVGRGPSISTPFREPERGVPEELMSPVVPVKVAPGRSAGVLGPTYHGDGNPLSESEMQKSALKLEKENKEKVTLPPRPPGLPPPAWCFRCT